MTSDKETQEKIDAALDAALDDLDDDDDDECKQVLPPQPLSPQNPSRPVHGPPLLDAMGSFDDMMKQLMQGDPGKDQTDAFVGRLIQDMQSQIAELEQVETRNAPTSPSSPKKPESAPSSDVDQVISNVIEGMTNQAKLEEPNRNEMAEHDMLKSMMNQLGDDLGGEAGFNSDALIDGMMEQLLAKDLMYEPMKHVAEKFPNWLEQNRGKVPQEEYEKRCQQYQCFQKLVRAYDTEPDNVPQLMLLMEEVQEFGQPPTEIVQDIAPGLEFDADGLPKLNGMVGQPFPGGEECQIM